MVNVSPNNSLPRLLTTKEAAMYLYGKNDRVTLNRIYRLVANGELKIKKLGRTNWFQRSYLEFITENQN
jgi:excisionase family DNA binding protein